MARSLKNKWLPRRAWPPALSAALWVSAALSPAGAAAEGARGSLTEMRPCSWGFHASPAALPPAFRIYLTPSILEIKTYSYWVQLLLETAWNDYSICILKTTKKHVRLKELPGADFSAPARHLYLHRCSLHAPPASLALFSLPSLGCFLFCFQ